MSLFDDLKDKAMEAKDQAGQTAEQAKDKAMDAKQEASERMDHKEENQADNQ